MVVCKACQSIQQFVTFLHFESNSDIGRTFEMPWKNLVCSHIDESYITLDTTIKKVIKVESCYELKVLHCSLCRPHPYECSGSDLDGDLYFVSWDELLIPPEQDPPMDYVGRQPIKLDHDVTTKVCTFSPFLGKVGGCLCWKK
jgi:hypothetical protein